MAVQREVFQLSRFKRRGRREQLQALSGGSVRANCTSLKQSFLCGCTVCVEDCAREAKPGGAVGRACPRNGETRYDGPSKSAASSGDDGQRCSGCTQPNPKEEVSLAEAAPPRLSYTLLC